MAKKKYQAAKPVAQESFPTPIALGIKAFALTGLLIFVFKGVRVNGNCY